MYKRQLEIILRQFYLFTTEEGIELLVDQIEIQGIDCLLYTSDAMLNTAMLYELAVIKTQAEPLLQQVPENCEEYAEAYQMCIRDRSSYRTSVGRVLQ